MKTRYRYKRKDFKFYWKHNFGAKPIHLKDVLLKVEPKKKTQNSHKKCWLLIIIIKDLFIG